jgi:MFS family permease
VIGLTSYVPLFVQGVLGTSALVAGFALAALTIGWPLSASLAGRVYLRVGFRTTGLIGAVIGLGGSALLLLLSPQSTVWQVAVTCFVVGLGMGMVASPTLVAAQSTVDWESRGVVTGTNMFARSMGSALGIAVFGAIANASLSAKLNGHSSGTASSVPASALAPAMHEVFIGAAVVAVVLLAAVALMPRKMPLPS